VELDAHALSVAILPRVAGGLPGDLLGGGRR
jgi:hypothetical protein